MIPLSRRARLQLMQLEDRILLDGNQVGLSWLTEAAEPASAGSVRLTRSADETSLASPLTVSLRAGGSATRGTDYQFADFTGTGEDVSVTFAAGESTQDILVNAIDDALSEGWEYVSLDLLAGTDYTLTEDTSTTVSLQDEELWLGVDADDIVTGQEVTFSLDAVPEGATIEWDRDYDGTTFDALAGATDPFLAATFSTAGSITVAARVTASTAPASVVTLTVSIADAPPEVTVPEDLTVTAGQTIELQASAASALGIVTVEWWVSYEEQGYELDPSLTTLTPSYTFTDYGEYDLWLVVTDTAGNKGEGWFHVAAENAGPDAALSYANADGVVGGPVTEGSDVFFTVTGLGAELDLENTDDLSVWVDWYGTGEFDLLHEGLPEDYEWAYDATTASLYFKGHYADGLAAGTYSTKVHLEDDFGATAAFTVEVPVANVAPTVTVTAGTRLTTNDKSGQEVWGILAGQRVELRAVDPSPVDQAELKYHWTIDGTARPGNSPVISLPDYEPGHIYTITAHVTDKDGGRSDDFVFTVAVFPTDHIAVTVVRDDTGGWYVPPLEAPEAGEVGQGMVADAALAAGPIYGTLLPSGATAPPRYNRYGFLPVVKPNDAIGSDFGVTFQLDQPSLDYAQAQGATVRYQFYAEVWDIKRNLIFADNHFVVDSAFLTNTTGVLTMGQDGAPSYAAEDRMVVITAQAQLMKNGQVFRESPFYQVLAKTPQTRPLTEQFAAMIQTIRDMFGQIGDRASALISALTNSPRAVLSALLVGTSGALGEFFANWKVSLVKPFLEWLGPNVNLTNLNLDSLSSSGIAPFLLQFSGLTWDNIQNIALQELGEGNVAAVSRLADTIFAGLDMNDGNSLMTFLGRFANPQGELAQYVETIDLTKLKDDAIQALTEKGASALAGVVPQLVAKFFPGPGSLFAAYQALQRGLSWFLDNQDNLRALFDKLIEAVDHLITPNADGVKAALLQALTGDGSRLLISLAATQLGLGKLPNELKNALSFIPRQVEAAVRATVRKLATAVNTGVNPVYNGRLQDSKTFELAGTNLALFAARDSQGVKVKVVSQSGVVHKLEKVLDARDLITLDGKAHLADYLTKARDLAAAAKGVPRNRTPGAAVPNRFAELKTKQEAVNAARDVLLKDLQACASPVLLGGCFAAGTKLRTRDGWKRVEEIVGGDELASRSELDPFGAIEYQPVERTFARSGRVLHLHLADGFIRTTPEHPFWVEGAGWTQAGALRAGDRLATHGGAWAVVEELYDTGSYERVYNCRVAEHHTYFVLPDGADEVRPECAVWAHNTYEFVSGTKVADEVTKKVTLTAAERTLIIEYVAQPTKAKASYGWVANEKALVGLLVAQLAPAPGVARPHASLADALAKYFVLPNVKSQTEQLNKAIDRGPSGGWIDYIKTFPSDARGMTWTDYEAEFNRITDTSLASPVPVSNRGHHGHHIIFKNGITSGNSAAKAEARKEAQKAKDILLYYGLNPYWDRESLAFAQNFNHNLATIQYMVRELEAEVKRIGKELVTKADLAAVLKNFADAWVKHELTGMTPGM